MEYCGILPIFKPQGFTSFDVIAKLRGILRMRRIGHAGTLDPMATGVLPVFLGNATRACDIIPCDTKAYSAGFELGITTDTQDITGVVLDKSSRAVSLEELERACLSFRGTLRQLPPMYSAVTVNGRRLYDLAREGITVEREAKEITVHRITLTQYSPETRTGSLELEVSRGTYIRTIIHDLGSLLGCGGTMTSLVRTSSAGIALSECLTLEEISALCKENMLSEKIIPTERLFESLARVELDEVQTKMYKNGVKLDISRIDGAPTASCRCGVYGGGAFIGTGRIDIECGELSVEKNFTHQ